ncbi:MAG: DNA internalization-related competence protein ComEC/Rec2 [Lachnospiraceae bacterium]|nr:DNA internalization-related competence protein ComEC/Rec2 [Lachnospiraceae bacterium]
MIIKRPLLWYAGAYALGEVLALQSGGLVPVVWLSAAGGAAAVCRRRKRGGQSRHRIWFALPFFFLLGSFRLWSAQEPPAIRKLDDRLLEERNLTAALSGKVERIELRTVEGRESFRLLLSGCDVGTDKEEVREAESFSVGRVLVSMEQLPEGVEEGREVCLEVCLSEMEESGNPGQFDSRSYYRGQGISYRAKGTACLEVSGRTDRLRMGLRLLRQYFSENLLRTAGEGGGGLLCAMVLGEKWEADKKTVSLYEESGMGHLLAISGLHISLAGMGIYRLLRKRLRCSYLLAASGCAAMSFCYYLLTGEGTSAGRAFFMLTVYGIGQIFGRQYDLASAAALAAFVMLFGHPFLLFQSGFLLSFGSVLALGILYPAFLKAELPKFLKPLFPGLSIQLATLPVQAYFFYKLPVYSLLLNLIVLPLFTAAALLGIAGALLGGLFPGVMPILLLPAGGILWLYEALGKWSLSLPGAVWRMGRPKAWQLLLCGTLLLLFYRWIGERTVKKEEQSFGWKGFRKKLPGLLMLLGMIFCLKPIRYRGMELIFLDVGQGDSCFLRTAGGITFLMDGGSSGVQKVGEYRLGPFLDSQAVDQVDFALASHGDADHINGIGELIEQRRVGTLILPRGRTGSGGLKAIEEKAKEAGVPVVFLGGGEQLFAGEAVFTCLWPETSGENGTETLDENEASMVLWLSWKEFDAVFTGDLEGRGETEVTARIKRYREASGRDGADILKVSHHGSGSTSSAGFLEAAAPKWGIISCGRWNPYGHPAEETLKRLEDAGCQVFRTDLDKAVRVRSDGRKVEISGYGK